LSPQHYLDSKSQSSDEWEDDGCKESHEEGEEGPDGEHEEEDDDDQHVRHHPGDEQEMFVEHGTKEKEEREEQVKNYRSNDSKQNRLVMSVKKIEVRYCYAQNLLVSLMFLQPGFDKITDPEVSISIDH